MDNARVEPRIPRGFQDFLPERMIPRQRMIDTIRGVYELHGFSPIETPAVELEEVLTGQLGSDKEIFRFLDGDQHVALRFDLTVPLARVCAQYSKVLPTPFRRYHVGPVWRDEKPRPGRFREFVQFDIDIVGDASVDADVEVLVTMVETLRSLGVPRFVVRANHRQALQAMIAFAGVDVGQTDEVLRTLDKLSRLGWEAVSRLLGNAPGDPLPGIDVVPLGLPADSVERIRRFVEIRGGDNGEVLEGLRAYFGDYEPARRAIADLEHIDATSRALGLPEGQVEIDLSIARGLSYYTGPIFETTITDLPSHGSVCSGGRYDGLVARFGDETVPATGASIGVDRLFSALEELGLVKARPSVTEALVVVLDRSMMTEYWKLAAELRAAGVRTEVFLGQKGLKAQMRYANRQGIRVACLLGGDELQKGVVAVKRLDMEIEAQGKQVEVPRAEVAARVRDLVAG